MKMTQRRVRIAVIVLVHIFNLALLCFYGVLKARPVKQRQSEKRRCKSGGRWENPGLRIPVFRFRRHGMRER